MGFIYKITNKINNKIYIGQTRFTIQQRFKQHIYEAKNQKDNFPLHLAIYKYGIQNFQIEKIEQVQDSLLNEREIYWIKTLNSYIKDGNGYNCTLGGEGNSIINTTKVFNLWDNGLSIQEICNELNHDRSSIRKILQSYKNYSIQESNLRGDKIQSKNRFKQIKQYSLQGKYLNTFYNMYEAERQTKISSKNIWGAVNHKQKTAGGYQWRFEDDLDTPENISNKTRIYKQKVMQIHKDTNSVLAIFESAADAERKTGIKAGQIRKVCQGKGNTAGNFKWKYQER